MVVVADFNRTGSRISIHIMLSSGTFPVSFDAKTDPPLIMLQAGSGRQILFEDDRRT